MHINIEPVDAINTVSGAYKFRSHLYGGIIQLVKLSLNYNDLDFS